MEHNPITLEVKVNYACNNTCDFCSFGNLRAQKMTYQNILDNIRYIKERFPNVNHLEISGGEPTIRADLLSILRFARAEMEIPFIGLHTNAIRLHDAELTREIGRYLDLAVVSFHSQNRDVLASLVHKHHPETFDRIVMGICNLRANGIPLITNTLILADNYRFLPEIASLISTFEPIQAIFTYPFFLGNILSAGGRQVAPLREIDAYLQEAISLLSWKGTEVSLNSIPFCQLEPSTLDAYIKARAQANTYRKTTEQVGQSQRITIDLQHQFDKYVTFGFELLGFEKTRACDPCAWSAACMGIWRGHVVLGKYGEPLPL